MNKKERRRIRKEKRENKSSKQQAETILQDNPTTSDATTNFHSDKRETMVKVGNTLYSLTPTSLTIERLKKKPFQEIPHVRYLAPIPIRTSEEQSHRERDKEEIHDLSQQCNGRSTEITSTRKAIREGKNPKDEVMLLLKEKEGCKDEQRCRLIRRRLRKLDYKRYINE